MAVRERLPAAQGPWQVLASVFVAPTPATLERTVRSAIAGRTGAGSHHLGRPGSLLSAARRGRPPPDSAQLAVGRDPGSRTSPDVGAARGGESAHPGISLVILCLP